MMPDMRLNALSWISLLAVLALALWVRANWIEQESFGFFCDGGGQTLVCKLRWLTVLSFNQLGLGYVALFLGVLAALTRSGQVGLVAAWFGMAGLVLYCWDYAAVGFLLGVLTLARVQFNECRT